MDTNIIRQKADRKDFFPLSVLLVLFCLRVAGQLLVVLYQVPFLPPMQEWQSGLLPYSVLLALQVLIIGTFIKVCRDFYAQDGFFYEAKAALAEPLMTFGKAYVVLNAVRLLIWQTAFGHHIWFAGIIPIVFHFVLASFLIIVAAHHRKELIRRTSALNAVLNDLQPQAIKQ
ncbi:MAG: hypothetical protein JST89_04705 [Cyanobacteria bacterium SZAS-4]|nr:hypothetical protein [Cyanobacteria bacterium SZAS-4]